MAALYPQSPLDHRRHAPVPAGHVPVPASDMPGGPVPARTCPGPGPDMPRSRPGRAGGPARTARRGPARTAAARPEGGAARADRRRRPPGPPASTARTGRRPPEPPAEKSWPYGAVRCSKAHMTERYPVRPISPDEFDAFHLVESMPSTAGRCRPGSGQGAVAVRVRPEPGRVRWQHPGRRRRRVQFPHAPARDAGPVAGVSWVDVLPPYRRRGILTRIMHRQLADIRDRGEALAALFASEAGSTAGTVTAARPGRHVPQLARPWAAGRGCRPTPRCGCGSPSPAGPRRDGQGLRRAGPRRVFLRGPRHGGTGCPTTPKSSGRSSPMRCLLAEDDSGRAGTRCTPARAGGTRTFLPDNELDIRESVAVDPAAAPRSGPTCSAGTWSPRSGCIRPVDDPLLDQLADPRRLRPLVTDGLWIASSTCPRRSRCAATRARWTWSSRWATASWRKTPSAGGSGWRIRDGRLRAGGRGPLTSAWASPNWGPPTSAGTRLGALAAAGRVTQHRTGALAHLSAAMSGCWPPGARSSSEPPAFRPAAPLRAPGLPGPPPTSGPAAPLFSAPAFRAPAALLGPAASSGPAALFRAQPCRAPPLRSGRRLRFPVTGGARRSR